MQFEADIRVRFSDTDMYGHVNNAVYATYMEEARIQFMEQHFGGFRLPLILAKANYQYVQQTRFPEHRNLAVQLWVTRIGRSSADLFSQLTTLDGTILCTCDATVVQFDYEKQKSAPYADEVRSVFERYLHEDEVKTIGK